MAYTRMSVTSADGIGCIELDQPDEYNRMPPAFWEELPRAVAELDAAGDVRTLIVAFTGRHFSAGMDLSAFTAGGPAPAADSGRRGEASRRCPLSERFHGAGDGAHAGAGGAAGGIGGGVDLVSARDMRYCTRDAFFCIKGINIGLIADVGPLQRLPLLMPDGLMRELACSGRRLQAEEALQCGLVN